ncbi:hypothetical protein GCM10010439_55440 [Actinocorallia aurantiaca]|uniref:Secreted protein n=1 Tax=Actinocorallia aurantiaca TaxID=46204 RepID=A0ABP6H3A8_9ACTN
MGHLGLMLVRCRVRLFDLCTALNADDGQGLGGPLRLLCPPVPVVFLVEALTLIPRLPLEATGGLPEVLDVLNMASRVQQRNHHLGIDQAVVEIPQPLGEEIVDQFSQPHRSSLRWRVLCGRTWRKRAVAPGNPRPHLCPAFGDDERESSRPSGATAALAERTGGCEGLTALQLDSRVGGEPLIAR